MNDELEGKHGVQSLEVGMGILKAMVFGKRSMMLKDIAAAADMPPSKAHRYLVSLIRSGLVEQDPLTSRYNLGPFALNIGLVAIDRLDRIRLGLAAISELRDEINETTALAVWGDNGPVIVRWERPRRPITVNVVTGTTLGVLSSAAGRVFAAWLPNATRAIVKREVEQRRNLPPGVETLADADALLASVRERGLAVISGNYLFRGVEAAAAPVFNFKNELTMALVIVGVEGSIDMSPESEVLARLKGAADALSLRLGSTRDSDAAAPSASSSAA